MHSESWSIRTKWRISCKCICFSSNFWFTVHIFTFEILIKKKKERGFYIYFNLRGWAVSRFIILDTDLRDFILFHPLRLCQIAQDKFLQNSNIFCLHARQCVIEKSICKKLLERQQVLLELGTVEHAPKLGNRVWFPARHTTSSSLLRNQLSTFHSAFFFVNSSAWKETIISCFYKLIL